MCLKFANETDFISIYYQAYDLFFIVYIKFSCVFLFHYRNYQFYLKCKAIEVLKMQQIFKFCIFFVLSSQKKKKKNEGNFAVKLFFSYKYVHSNLIISIALSISLWISILWSDYFRLFRRFSHWIISLLMSKSLSHQ